MEGAVKGMNLAGRVFGEWTVLERSANQSGKHAWLCRCSCGDEKVIRGAALFDGISRCCSKLKHGQGIFRVNKALVRT